MVNYIVKVLLGFITEDLVRQIVKAIFDQIRELVKRTENTIDDQLYEQLENVVFNALNIER